MDKGFMIEILMMYRDNEQSLENTLIAIDEYKNNVELISIDKTNFVVKETMKVDLYCCPKCEQLNVIDDDKYCSNCGIKLQWIK